MELFCTIAALTRRHTEKILSWRYDPPYTLYNSKPADEEEMLGGSYRAVLARDGSLSGFYCFGASARISSLSQDDFLDIGLGLRPALCGHGHGTSFVEKEMEYARMFFNAVRFRLVVAQLNQRAQLVYERAGFRPDRIILHAQTQQPFLIMKRTDAS